MRSRHATALSVAGVVAAGLVAGLVNARALAGSDGRPTTSLSSMRLDASTSASLGDTPDASTTPITVTTPSAPSASAVNSPPVQFQLGAPGTLTLDDVDGALDVVAIAPAPGWSVSAMTSVDAATVVVDFTSANASLRATAVVRDSVISVDVTEMPVQTTSTVQSTRPPDDGDGHGSDDDD